MLAIFFFVKKFDMCQNKTFVYFPAIAIHSGGGGGGGGKHLISICPQILLY